MLNWHAALLVFAALWGVQVAGTALQARHVQATLAGVARQWKDGYVGCGSSRGFLSAGCVVMLVAGPDLVVRAAFLMRGYTVFARLRPDPSLAGLTLVQLRSGAGFAAQPRKAAAVQAAIAQLDRVREKAAMPAGGLATMMAPGSA